MMWYNIILVRYRVMVTNFIFIAGRLPTRVNRTKLNSSQTPNKLACYTLVGQKNDRKGVIWLAVWGGSEQLFHRSQLMLQESVDGFSRHGCNTNHDSHPLSCHHQTETHFYHIAALYIILYIS